LADPEGRSYYRCTAELVEQRGSPPPRGVEVPDLALEAWRDEAVYDGELLFHGPAFQAIRDIAGVSQRGLVAQLSGVDGSDWQASGPWSSDPLAFDGGLQLALLWCKHVLGGASLPTGIGEIRSWVDAPVRGPIRCTLTGRTAKGQKSVSDLVFQDASGKVIAEFVGVETHLRPGQPSDQKQA
jgi:hypothetical protein